MTQAQFHHSKQEAEGIYSFYFEPESPFRYIAGQFIEMTLPHSQADKRGDKRWFTLSSSPHDTYLAITTKFYEEPSSFKQALMRLKPGDNVTVSSPMGDFVLPKDDRIPLIFVAAGIGVTPFHSIIAHLQATSQQRDLTLLYATTKQNQHAFAETFEQLKSKYLPLTTSENAGQPLTAQSILGLTKPTEHHYLYLSGPEILVEQLTHDLRHAGINQAHIFTDYFLNYQEL